MYSTRKETGAPHGTLSSTVNAKCGGSLVALWLSQLIVVAVYPRFAVRHGGRTLPHVAAACGASAVMLFGLWNSVSNAAST